MFLLLSSVIGAFKATGNRSLNLKPLEGALQILAFCLLAYGAVIGVISIIDAANRNQVDALPVKDVLGKVVLFAGSLGILAALYAIFGLPFPNLLP